MAEMFPTRSERRRDVLEVIAQAADELLAPDGPLPVDSSPAIKADCAADALIAAIRFADRASAFEVKARDGVVEVTLPPAAFLSGHFSECLHSDCYTPAEAVEAARLVVDGRSVVSALVDACAVQEAA